MLYSGTLGALARAVRGSGAGASGPVVAPVKGRVLGLV